VTKRDTTSSLSKARIATRFYFFAGGFANAAWAPMVPFAKARTGLGTAGFGSVLMGLGLGAIVVMPLISWALRRHGSRRCLIGSSCVIAVVLPLLAVLPDPVSLALALFAFGMGIGGFDASMNSQAVDVEAASHRPLMSGFHGMFSIGGLAGSLGLTALLSTGLPVLAGALVITTLFIALWLPRGSGLLPGGSLGRSASPTPPWTAAFHPIVLFIGMLCVTSFLGEGATLDWSAIYLHAKGLPTAYGGLGYAAFSVTMAFGRLTGDRAVQRLGVVPLLRLSGLVAALGWGVAIVFPGPIAVLGFALVGLGASNIVPLLFGAAARVPGMPTNVSLPLITALGYGGMLCGPALIGIAASATSLSIALSGIGALPLVVVAAARVAGD
jgi:fucose permease